MPCELRLSSVNINELSRSPAHLQWKLLVTIQVLPPRLDRTVVQLGAAQAKAALGRAF